MFHPRLSAIKVEVLKELGLQTSSTFVVNVTGLWWYLSKKCKVTVYVKLSVLQSYDQHRSFLGGTIN